MRGKVGFISLVVFLAGSSAFGQQWAKKMFEQTRHDFGHVARGAKAEHEFVLSNIYIEDVHIASVRSSCGCTSPRIKEEWLKTYEKGAIIAAFNTRSFLGRKGATVTVTFDRPFHAQVQLHVTGYIRSDVILRPGSVQLGSLDQGRSADATISVDYAGRAEWKILGVRSKNPHLSAKVAETDRGPGRISYDLLVHLDDGAPAGPLSDHLALITNDRRSKQIPVRVEGRVRPAVTVSPASLFVGALPPGRQVTKRLVVQGKKPFRIVSITCEDDSLKLETPAHTAVKSLHVIPVTFTLGGQPGKLAKTIRIETDLADTTAVLSAHAVVLAP